MFRLIGTLCILTFGGMDQQCTQHYRDDFKTWSTQAECEAIIPAVMEETMADFTRRNFAYESFIIECEPVTQEQLDKEIERFNQGFNSTIDQKISYGQEV
mgnify:CR=1 FL=1